MLIVIGGFVAASGGRVEPSLRQDLRRWLRLVAYGTLVVVTAYAAYVPAPIAFYQPLAAGSSNRVNIMASVGFAAVVVGLVLVIGAAVTALLRRPARWARVIGLGLGLIVMAGYVHRTREDIAAWDRAGAIQRQEISTLKATGRPPAGTTVYTFGGVGTTCRNAFAFRVTWDLNGAAELLWDDPTVHAFPIFAGTQMTCTATQVIPVGFGNGDWSGPGRELSTCPLPGPQDRPC